MEHDDLLEKTLIVDEDLGTVHEFSTTQEIFDFNIPDPFFFLP